MTDAFGNPAFLRAAVVAVSLCCTCAVLSVLVVLRRWAFIGEGISHGGFGGAGTVWLLAAFFPALDHPAYPYAGVVVACLTAALVIGYLSRSGKLNADAAIGIFLVASLAWGFMANSVYWHHRHMEPVGGNLFLGQLKDVSRAYAVGATGLCAAILLALGLLKREILFYCFDPTAAEVSGVRAGLIHYLLLALVALTIVIGAPVAGTVLITALLVLPGATALLLSERLGTVTALSVAFGATGAVGGLILAEKFPFIPGGPAIVLVLVAVFVSAYLVSRLRKSS